MKWKAASGGGGVGWGGVQGMGGWVGRGDGGGGVFPDLSVTI